MVNTNREIKEEKSLTSDLSEASERSNFRLLALVVLLSFLFGMAGSVFGTNFFNKNTQNLIKSEDEIKTIQVNEQSAVVDVVKRASPAVVSLIISKDLNKIPGYSSTPSLPWPFSLDPFFNSRGDSDGSGANPNVQEIGGGSG